MNCFYFYFTKADGSTGAGLPNAVFELHSTDGPVQTAVSDADGCVQFSVMPCCTYLLTERTPPPGYAPHFASHRIYIDACGQVFVNGTLISSLTLVNFKLPRFSQSPTSPTAAQTVPSIQA